MKLLNVQKRLWAEVNLDNAKHNFLQIKQPLCCVIKANAYGHGAIQLAKLYEKLGARYFAVSNIEEAIQLRLNGVKGHILVLGYTPAECADKLARFDIEQTLFNEEYANKLNDYCEKYNVFVKIHLKIDTGMGRIGFQYHDGVNELQSAFTSCSQHFLKPVGIFTHFSCSDDSTKDLTLRQFGFFSKAIDFFANKGLSFSIKHCSNSAAVINFPSFHLDMVRAGIVLYGINPTQNHEISIKPVLSLWSVVSNVKMINKGDYVSYGGTFKASEDMKVATIPIGYADGFWRSNQGHFVYINGEFCEIIGRVCMDQIMVRCNDAKIGDLVEIYGKHISVEEVAKYNHTIPYEILCSIGERVPRVYTKKGKIIKIIDKLI